MTYASTSIDRRAEYYAKCADVIASDPLDFYTRAEKGRRFIAGWLYASTAAPAMADLFESRLSAPKLADLVDNARHTDARAHDPKSATDLRLVRGSLAA